MFWSDLVYCSDNWIDSETLLVHFSMNTSIIQSKWTHVCLQYEACHGRGLSLVIVMLQVIVIMSYWCYYCRYRGIPIMILRVLNTYMNSCTAFFQHRYSYTVCTINSQVVLNSAISPNMFHLHIKMFCAIYHILLKLIKSLNILRTF